MPDAVIVSTARTPIGRAVRGAFNITHGADLCGHVISHAVKRAGKCVSSALRQLRCADNIERNGKRPLRCTNSTPCNNNTIEQSNALHDRCACFFRGSVLDVRCQHDLIGPEQNWPYRNTSEEIAKNASSRCGLILEADGTR